VAARTEVLLVVRLVEMAVELEAKVAELVVMEDGEGTVVLGARVRWAAMRAAAVAVAVAAAARGVSAKVRGAVCREMPCRGVLRRSSWTAR
jgi:hypothetical protein